MKKALAPCTTRSRSLHALSPLPAGASVPTLQVAGVIETSQPGARSALYQDSIKKGDVLLNRVQKLSRVIDAE